MLLWFVVLVCSPRRLLADGHSLPFPCPLALRMQWCQSTSHHPISFLSLLACGGGGEGEQCRVAVVGTT